MSSSPRSILSSCHSFDFTHSSSSSSLSSSSLLTLRLLHCDDLSLDHNLLASELTVTERTKVNKFRLDSDKKLSLGSILLQHHVIQNRFRCEKSHYEIVRSSHGKPSVVSKSKSCGYGYGYGMGMEIGNWNYNVSHHGNYVGIVESENGNIGLDIATLTPRKSWTGNATEYIDMFVAQFTPNELKWQKNVDGDCDVERYRRFFINWSLKEAYIKAIGKGLSMDLQDLDFVIEFLEPQSRQGEIEIESESETESEIESGSITITSESESEPSVSLSVGGEFESETIGFQGQATLFFRGREEIGWTFVFSSLDVDHVASIAMVKPSSESSLSFQPLPSHSPSSNSKILVSPPLISPVRLTLNDVLEDNF